jgi:hypothetical protein
MWQRRWRLAVLVISDSEKCPQSVDLESMERPMESNGVADRKIAI